MQGKKKTISQYLVQLNRDKSVLPSSALECMPVNREDGCVEYLWEAIVSASVPEVLLFKPLLIDVSPGRNITEKPPLLLLFITVVSSDGEEHVSDFVSRNNGDPDRCIVRGSTEWSSTNMSEQ